MGPKLRSSTQKAKIDPVDSSTPRNSTHSVVGRRSIHDSEENSTLMLSPISKDSPDSDESLNNKEDESSDKAHLVDHLNKPALSQGSENLITESSYSLKYLLILLVSVFVIIVGCFLVYQSYRFSDVSVIETKVTLEDIKKHFPSQANYLWPAFSTGIKDVVEFDKPSVFLLLYEDEDASQQTINKLVLKLSQYGVCEIIGNCTIKPIVLTHEDFYSKEVLTDYGYLIVKYKTELENKGVMVVNNIEQVKGVAAQVFHSMCDEFEPLVNKVAYIFTMKINKFPEDQKHDMKFVETTLKRNWNDIKGDVFYPLFTRITSMLLRVLAEAK